MVAAMVTVQSYHVGSYVSACCLGLPLTVWISVNTSDEDHMGSYIEVVSKTDCG